MSSNIKMNLTSVPTLESIANATGNLDILEETPSIDKFVPANWIQIVWSAVFILMVLVAVIGNLAVISIILGERGMRTKTNLFLLNLSLADLMMAAFNAMFNFVYMLHNSWLFGHSYCLINNFISSTSVAASIFTITATSIDR